MKISWYRFLMLLLIVSARVNCYQQFDLSSPDITAEKVTANGATVTLKGYKWIGNADVLRAARNNSTAAVKLLWSAVGQPTVLKASTSAGNTTKSHPSIRFSSAGFYVRVRLLTDGDAALLAASATKKFGVKVAAGQIHQLELSSFTCRVSLRNPKSTLIGEVTNVENFPLLVEFSAPIGSEIRRRFEQQLGADVQTSMSCEMCLGDGVGQNITETPRLPIDNVDVCRQEPSVTSRLYGDAVKRLDRVACFVNSLGYDHPLVAAATRKLRRICRVAQSDSSAIEIERLVVELRRRTEPPMSHRLAMRAAYNTRNNRLHNLLNSWRFQAAAAGANVSLGYDGVHVRGSGGLAVREAGDLIAGLLPSLWSCYLSVQFKQAVATPQRLLLLRDGSSGWQFELLVGNNATQLVSLLSRGDSFAAAVTSTVAMVTGKWYRIAVAQIGTAATHIVNGVTISDHSPAANLPDGLAPAAPADAADSKLLIAPQMHGIVRCFGLLGVTVTQVEMKDVFSMYC